MAHPIELEVRAELTKEQIQSVLVGLLAAGFEHRSSTRRTMLMSFSRVGRIAEDKEVAAHEPQETDIRCRVTNGAAEVVVKLGGVHAHDRKEISTPVTVEMLPAFARVIGAMNMLHKVGSRTTENLERGEISAAIVSSPSGLAYLELEKISDEQHADADREELEKLARELQVPLIETREAFMRFCSRLTEQDDWMFYGSDEEVQRFMKETEETGATKTVVSE